MARPGFTTLPAVGWHYWKTSIPLGMARRYRILHKQKAPTKAGAFLCNWCRKQESNLRPTPQQLIYRTAAPGIQRSSSTPLVVSGRAGEEDCIAFLSKNFRNYQRITLGKVIRAEHFRAIPISMLQEHFNRIDTRLIILRQPYIGSHAVCDRTILPLLQRQLKQPHPTCGASTIHFDARMHHISSRCKVNSKWVKLPMLYKHLSGEIQHVYEYSLDLFFGRHLLGPKSSRRTIVDCRSTVELTLVFVPVTTTCSRPVA